MTALKVLVVAMGVAILAMIALIGVQLAKRLGGVATERALETQLGLPEGAQILSAVPADGQLALTLRLPDGSTRAAVIDLATGRTLAIVRP